MATELTRLFRTEAEWERWLAKHYATATGIWMRIAKRDSGLASVTYQEALDVALCHGWIDAQKRSFDERTFLQRWCPRGKKSIWSQINREKVKALIRAKRMKPAGLTAVSAAKKDGRWARAYAGAKAATVPADFAQALSRKPKAKALFETLRGSSRYAFLFRLHTASTPAIRAKRVREFVAMLEAGRAFHT